MKDIKKIYEDSTIRKSQIKITTNTPGLKDKIQVNIDENSDKVYWYIRFNTPLDPSTVSKKTMSVTETNGYILETNIMYDQGKNVIVISPADIYMQNEYYLLNISKKVKSAKGQNLKKEIHIMFKLMGNEISEFQILKDNVKIPKPKPRTKEYQKELKKRIESVSKVYRSLDESIYQKIPQYKLPYAGMKLNVLVAVLGVACAVVGAVLGNFVIIMVSLGICLLGMLHVLLQVMNKEIRSTLVYNFGVTLFNIGKYQGAHKKFKKAFELSPMNEMAEYALNKSTFYL